MTEADALRHDLETSYAGFLVRRRRWRRAQAGILVCTCALVLAGAAFGSAALFGWPAPLHVKSDLAAVDRGLPADLRLNPDVEHARAVASTETATLYAATLRDGGSCTEIVTDRNRGRGAGCTTGAELPTRALDVTVPADDGEGPEAPVVLGGRANSSAASSVEVLYSDGATDAIPLGDDRYFLFDVPPDHRAAVHANGLTVIARDDRESVIDRTSVPSDWDDPAVPDENAPLYVSTRSDQSDFTKVYGLEGHVSVAGAARLELRYGDGTEVAIPIEPDGSYEYTVPADRVGDFMQPRTLVALDATGKIVASTPVAAVAYWRGRERGRS